MSLNKFSHMKVTFSLFLILFLSVSLSAQDQSSEDLKKDLAEKKDNLTALKSQVTSLEKEIAAISSQLIEYPYWEKGGSGLLGFDFNSFNNWATRGPDLNSSATSIGLSFNGFTNKIGEDYFWKNNGSLVLGWQKFDRGDEDNTGFQKTADIFNVQSLYGRNLSKTLSLSTLGELRTTFLENSFNPGYLDLGVGLTWNPAKDLTAVFHPMNYNIVIASEDIVFKSSFGCKFVVNYARKFNKVVSWRTNVSGFLSYKDVDLLSNYTWTNGFNFKLVNNLGVGIEYSIRQSKQETSSEPLSDGDFQSYFLFGLTYAI